MNHRPLIVPRAVLISPGCPAWLILCCNSIFQKKSNSFALRSPGRGKPDGVQKLWSSNRIFVLFSF